MKQTSYDYRPCIYRLLRCLPVITWMGTIFWLSSRTGSQLNQVLPWLQQWFPFMTDFNWGHLAAYFILALLFDFAIGSAADKWRIKVVIVAACFFYGVTDEFHQQFVEGRMPDVTDLRNDTIGAALAVIILRIPIIRKYWREISK